MICEFCRVEIVCFLIRKIEKYIKVSFEVVDLKGNCFWLAEAQYNKQ